jgi:uncharacterized protein YvpB
MLLNYRRIQVSKLTLAKQIEKVPFSYMRHGKYLRGNPNDAFVGDIYTYRKAGYGVYIKPIIRLANRYVGTRAINLTGASRDVLIENLSKNRPILVIASNDFQKVDRLNWKTWTTSAGRISVSYYEHCFLLIGYDAKYFYVRDPLQVQTKVDIPTFIASWQQFGSQAMTIH